MEQDLLLEVTGSDYSLNPSREELVKVPSFNNLLSELFDHSSDSMCVDIMQDFADDSGSPELKQNSCALELPGITSLGCTLEFLPESTRLQVTQLPQEPPREGTTQKSTPELPRELLNSPTETRVFQTPSLPVFRICSAGGQPEIQMVPRNVPKDSEDSQLEQLDVEIVEEVLSMELNETTQPAAELQFCEIELSRLEAPEVLAPASPIYSELDRKVLYIQEAIARYHSEGGAAPCCNGKLQVHEVVLALLLAPKEAGLAGVLDFCDSEGRVTSRISDNFVAKDTKTMGLIWQKIKKNKNGNYDTFARAMRVGRERRKEYFDYLSAGKGSRKRVYQLGTKCRRELVRMKQILNP